MLNPTDHGPSSAWRGGFTIVEIIVTLLIMAALAAVMVPALKARVDAAEAAGIISNLTEIRQASLAYRENVGRYPKRLTQLQARPGASIGNTDICGGTLPQSAMDAWRGPYLAQRFTSTGLPVGGATIRNELTRSPSDASTQAEGFLIVEVETVADAIGLEVDRAFDPLSGTDVDLGGGAVTWAAGLLKFFIAIRNC